MTQEKQEGWSRAPSFAKHYATVFGITKTSNLYRIDLGNERLQISNEEIVNISECQIIMDKSSFDALYELMTKIKNQKK